MLEKELRDAYHFIFEEELIQEMLKFGALKEVKAGETIINIGEYVKSMPLLLEGAIKILREDKDGDELLLYFLERGDTCAMTLSCCLGQTRSEIRAIAEKDTRLVMIPIEKMEEWTSRFKSWRNFVFESYHSRLSEMLDTIDTIAFLHMDERLMRYLQDKAKINKNEQIQVTHQEIAYDLHTSRVVVSRLLKRLELEGKIGLQRNSIMVHNL
jgi:CRP/FNR family transcriptional regulator